MTGRDEQADARLARGVMRRDRVEKCHDRVAGEAIPLLRPELHRVRDRLGACAAQRVHLAHSLSRHEHVDGVGNDGSRGRSRMGPALSPHHRALQEVIRHTEIDAVRLEVEVLALGLGDVLRQHPLQLPLARQEIDRFADQGKGPALGAGDLRLAHDAKQPTAGVRVERVARRGELGAHDDDRTDGGYHAVALQVDRVAGDLHRRLRATGRVALDETDRWAADGGGGLLRANARHGAKEFDLRTSECRAARERGRDVLDGQYALFALEVREQVGLELQPRLLVIHVPDEDDPAVVTVRLEAVRP